jgi:hypothetical protein
MIWRAFTNAAAASRASYALSSISTISVHPNSHSEGENHFPRGHCPLVGRLASEGAVSASSAPSVSQPSTNDNREIDDNPFDIQLKFKMIVADEP